MGPNGSLCSVPLKLRLGGARVDVAPAEDVIEAVARRLERGDLAPLFVASANLDHLQYYGRRSGQENAFDDHAGAQWMVLLDGMPMVWLSRHLLGLEVPLLAGSDLLPPLLLVAAARGARVGVLGGKAEMHDRLRARLSRELPSLEIAGTWSPGRDELASRARCLALAEEVRQSRVDLLVVGLGKPRQERFLLEHGLHTGARVAVAFGAAADFHAEVSHRAPEWVRGSGWEWAYRLLREPRRLARRYLLQGPKEAAYLLRDSGPWVDAAMREAFGGQALSPAAAAARIGVLPRRPEQQPAAGTRPVLVSVPTQRRSPEEQDVRTVVVPRRRDDRRALRVPVAHDRRSGRDRRTSSSAHAQGQAALP